MIKRITDNITCVAPLVGARIEILFLLRTYRKCSVAPLVGARIEMETRPIKYSKLPSLPSWERGLKSDPAVVAGFGVGRSPRGSED